MFEIFNFRPIIVTKFDLCLKILMHTKKLGIVILRTLVRSVLIL